MRETILLEEIRIKSLYQWRKDICDEFEKWGTFYTIQWFRDQLSQIDKLIQKLENEI